MQKILQLKYDTSLTDICERNSSFDSGTLRICYVGANRNNSYISKQSLEDAIPTLYNCPVVCHYDRESDSLGGHDVEFFQDEDGNLKMANVTQPVGLVPESARVWFENFTEDNGEVHEYLCAEVLLWKRQEAYEKIKRDGVTAHSMEIAVLEGKPMQQLFAIEKLEFNALCLIGVEPCFEGSALEFAKHDFAAQMAEMYKEFKASFANHSMEGGSDKMGSSDEKTKVFEEVETEEPAEPAEVETPAEGEPAIPEGEPEIEEEQPAAEPEEEGEPEGEPADEGKFNLNSNLVGEIVRALEKQTVDKGYGEVPQYWYVDCDTELGQVYCTDTADWLLYGFEYELTGDAITIKWESKARKQFAIVDFVDGEAPAPDVFSHMEGIEKQLAGFAEMQSKFDEATQQLNQANTELTELREFKHQQEAEQAQAQRDELFGKFEDKLGEVAEFTALKEDASKYDIDALEEKCYALCGRYGIVAKFAATQAKAPRFKVEKPSVEQQSKADEALPYGGLMQRYAK